jgi:hypothetical protein
VDEQVPDRNQTPVPTRQASFFGGGTVAPTFDTSLMRELVMYDFELDDKCVDALHASLIAEHIAPGPIGLAPSPPPPPPLADQCVAVQAHLHCCTEMCTYASDGLCDDGGPGSEFSICNHGSDCADCGTRCRSPVPVTPYIHSMWPSVTVNTGGTFVGTAFNTRAAIFNGAWTFAFVYRGGEPAGSHPSTLRYGSKQLIFDGARDAWKNVDSSVGIGGQLNCGYTQTGSSCSGGTNELDRGSCTAQTLFGNDHYYQCRSGAADGSNCPFVVAEGQGPRCEDRFDLSR